VLIVPLGTGYTLQPNLSKLSPGRAGGFRGWAAQSGLGSLARPDLTVCRSKRLRGRYRGPAVLATLGWPPQIPRCS